MKKMSHECIMCGKGYHHCNSCKNVRSYQPWRVVACSQECYKAYLVINEYNYKACTREEAKEMLERSEVDITTLLPEPRAIALEIMGQKEEVPVSKEKKTVFTKPRSNKE